MAFGQNHPPSQNVAAMTPAPVTSFQALVPNPDGGIFLNDTSVNQSLVPGGPFMNQT